MIALVKQDVFLPGRANDAGLVDLILACDSGEHALLLNPPFDRGDTSSPASAWLSTFSDDLQEALSLILEDGLSRAANLEPEVARVRVEGRSQSDWATASLTLHEAIRLLRTPLRLLVENHRNDFEFLLAILCRSEREELLRAVDDGRVHVLNGGGLGELKKRLEELFEEETLRARVERARLLVFIDRDADPKDRSEPSSESNEVLGLCQSQRGPWPLICHQLPCRAIENALPAKALVSLWVEVRGSNKPKRRRMLKVWKAFNADQRRAYNMKRGLLGDSSAARKLVEKDGWTGEAVAELDALFQGLRIEQAQELADGFRGLDAGACFKRMRDESWPWMDDDIERRGDLKGYRELVSKSLRDRM